MSNQVNMDCWQIPRQTFFQVYPSPTWHIHAFQLLQSSPSVISLSFHISQHYIWYFSRDLGLQIMCLKYGQLIWSKNSGLICFINFLCFLSDPWYSQEFSPKFKSLNICLTSSKSFTSTVTRKTIVCLILIFVGIDIIVFEYLFQGFYCYPTKKQSAEYFLTSCSFTLDG